jgi:hypothetical protein
MNRPGKTCDEVLPDSPKQIYRPLAACLDCETKFLCSFIE